MNFSRTNIKAEREPWEPDSIAIYLYQIIDSDGTQRVATGAVTMTMRDQTIPYENSPALRIRSAESQQFMDELWNAGIRPTAGAGSAGQLAATQKHLEDMRKIAVGLLLADGENKQPTPEP